MNLARRIKSAVSRHGWSGLIGRTLGGVWAKFYERLTVLRVELILEEWEPRLKRFGRDFEVFELERDDLETHRSMLSRKHYRRYREGFDRDVRLFFGLKKNRLACVVGGSSHHYAPNWGIRWQLADDQMILHRLDVPPAFRRGAAAGVTMEAVLEKLKNEGIRATYGVVSEKNRSSLIFGQRMGYRLVERQSVHRILTFFKTRPTVEEVSADAYVPRPVAKRAASGPRVAADD